MSGCAWWMGPKHASAREVRTPPRDPRCLPLPPQSAPPSTSPPLPTAGPPPPYAPAQPSLLLAGSLQGRAPMATMQQPLQGGCRADGDAAQPAPLDMPCLTANAPSPPTRRLPRCQAPALLHCWAPKSLCRASPCAPQRPRPPAACSRQRTPRATVLALLSPLRCCRWVRRIPAAACAPI